MAWADLAAARGITGWRSGPESTRFGYSVARLVIGRDPQDVTEADVGAQLLRLDADIVVVRHDASSTEVPACLVGHGWDVLAAAPIVYWRLRTGSGRPPRAVPDLTVTHRAATAETMGAPATRAVLDRLVAATFAGYGSHYAGNPLLDPRLALAGYQEWAQQSLEDEAHEVLTLLSGRDAVGFATLVRADPGPHLEILLAGLMPQAQGKGWYAHVLAAAESYAGGRHLGEVLISTQVHNAGVQRAWCRYGFEPVAAYATVHLVRAGLLAASRHATSSG